MHTLPPAMILLLRPFAPLFSKRVWCHVQVLIRDPQGCFATQALLCTDQAVAPEQIIAWFVRRWQMETIFEEVRRHLGVEIQRQWTDKAISRTTPALLGLFSLVTLLAHPHLTQHDTPIRRAAWYRKRAPTFADALVYNQETSSGLAK